MKTVLEERSRRSGPIYTLGPLLHNPQVVEDLRSQNIIPISRIADMKEGIVAYRSHGILREEEEYIGRQGLTALDTVCPWRPIRYR